MLWLSSLGGIGRFKGGGTLASAVSVLLFLPIALYTPWSLQVLLVLFVTGVGVPLSSYAAQRLGSKDPSEVVWDELAGMWLALLFAPLSLWYWCGAFVLFRLLDIAKPGPVGWCDTKLTGGLGIMADDVVAGAITLGVMQLLVVVIPIL